MPNPAPHPVAPAAPQQVDPLTAAKQVVWNGGDQLKGMTLGDILGTPGGVKRIKWIAESYTPRSDAGRAVKEAAKLILGSLEMGN